ncbi:hypothetical protein GCM10025866_18480 [Naasia aerilata]|uniref:Uncharacterized protein n=1 Tax=Naasia aerilata TaxID=1162966 RepID=A0ABN6XM30_9MICO|nr:hypothetical protein GCM10025866_18480 [Naasia aerilata]
MRWWSGLTRALKRRHVRKAIGRWAIFAAVVAVVSATIIALTAIDRINKDPSAAAPVPVPSQSALATGARPAATRTR